MCRLFVRDPLECLYHNLKELLLKDCFFPLQKIKPMLTYVLLFTCVAIVILGVIRASKQNPPHSARSPTKEPFIGEVPPAYEEADEIEMVGKPRIIRHAPTRHADAVENVSPPTPIAPARTSSSPLRTPTATATQQSMQRESTPSTARNNSIENTATVHPMGLKKSDTHLSSGINAQQDAYAEKPSGHSMEPAYQMESDTATTVPSSLSIKASTTVDTAPQGTTETDILVLHLLADAGCTYKGYALLQALLTAGLRYGKWGIFHRHEERTGRGSILFSLASSVEPGTFDLAKMSSFATPALTLFMRISAAKNPTQAFELLLTAAHQLVEELGGTLCDEKRNPLSMEKLTSWRERVVR